MLKVNEKYKLVDLIEDDVEETQSNEHSNILKPYNIDEIENPPNSLFKSVNSTLKEDNFLIQDRRKVAEKQRFLNTTEVIKNPVNIRTSSLVNSVNSGSWNNSQNRKELRQLNKARCMDFRVRSFLLNCHFSLI